MAQPRAPEAGRGGELLVGLVDVGRRGELLRPGERAEQLLPFAEGVASPHPVALHPECHVGPKPDRLLLAAGVCDVPVLGHRPAGRNPPVVEHGLAGQLHLDFALQAHRDADQHVIGVFVGRRTGVRRHEIDAPARPEDQRIPDDHPPRGGLPGRRQHVRAGLVDPGGWHVDAEWPEPERAGLAVEQAAEHAGCVEARHAQPVDRPVRCDQGAGVAVRQEGVLGDRRERGGHRRALRHRVGAGGRAGRRRPRGFRFAWLGRFFGGFCGAHDCTHGPCQPP